MKEEIVQFLGEELATVILELMRIALTRLSKVMKKNPKDKTHETYVKRMEEAKVYIAHLMLLIKLAKTLDLPKSAQNTNEQILLAALLHEAENEVENFELSSYGNE